MQVRDPADPLDLTVLGELVPHGDGVRRFAAPVEGDHGIVDVLVRRLVEVDAAQHLHHVRDGVLGEHHPAQHRLLGLVVVRHGAAVVLARPGGVFGHPYPLSSRRRRPPGAAPGTFSHRPQTRRSAVTQPGRRRRAAGFQLPQPSPGGGHGRPAGVVVPRRGQSFTTCGKLCGDLVEHAVRKCAQHVDSAVENPPPLGRTQANSANSSSQSRGENTTDSTSTST